MSVYLSQKPFKDQGLGPEEGHQREQEDQGAVEQDLEVSKDYFLTWEPKLENYLSVLHSVESCKDDIQSIFFYIN